ncbi:unnamed protein product [Tetraodon nigroviridis]|uniref:(spotted green pufferfish) hypothetical protein n=1 Tax=Tetraodon nigroviridis TaxID=99883 RepID=Q4RKN6_TETNG|nr:unnamed protein product [Tetraodon nigroviridis]CAG11046.1 unnamed protein product [Tetraodon nigroviridis]
MGELLVLNLHTNANIQQGCMCATSVLLVSRGIMHAEREL